MRDCEALGNGYTVGSEQAPWYLHLSSLWHLRVVASPGCCVLAFLCFPGPGQLNEAIFPSSPNVALWGEAVLATLTQAAQLAQDIMGVWPGQRPPLKSFSAVLANDPLDPMS